MSTYFIADTHFGHYNIIAFCNRPFKSVQEMNQTMIDRWNSVVSKEDIVYHLGDFALCHFEIAKHIFDCLNGTKFLIKGNHDGTNGYMLRLGFKDVMKSFNFYDSSIDKQILLIHDNAKATQDQDIILCGHLHEKQPFRKNTINVGVDIQDFYPKTLSQLI